MRKDYNYQRDLFPVDTTLVFRNGATGVVTGHTEDGRAIIRYRVGGQLETVRTFSTPETYITDAIRPDITTQELVSRYLDLLLRVQALEERHATPPDHDD